MNYPFKSLKSLVCIWFLIQNGVIHLCCDNSWCVTKTIFYRKNTGSHLHLSVRQLSIIYPVRCSHSNLVVGKLSHHIFKPEHTGSKQIHTFTWHTCSSQHINGFVLSGSHRFACDTVQGRLIPFQHIWAQELSSMQICSVIQRHDLRNTHSLKIYRILTSLTNHKKTKILFINIYILISIFYIWPIWLAMSCDHCRT